MALSFSNVSAITIPEGSVTKIAKSDGTVLWEGIKTITETVKNYTESYQWTSSGGIYTFTLSHTPTSIDDLTIDSSTLYYQTGSSYVYYLYKNTGIKSKSLSGKTLTVVASGANKVKNLASRTAGYFPIITVTYKYSS